MSEEHLNNSATGSGEHESKTEKSHYIITRLFATDYFYYYSSPLIFAAYFLPFIAFGKNRPYLDSEMEEKIRNIKDNRHGNFYNYSSQGFGNQAFYEPDISIEYFYGRLCSYETDKLTFFNEREGISSDLESDKMREDLCEILSDMTLLLKRKYLIPESIKHNLLKDLEKEQVKVVLAKLLYYIVSEEHKLPKVDTDTLSSVSQKLGLSACINATLNVAMGFRKEFDEEREELFSRIGKAREIQLLCLDGTSLWKAPADKNNVNEENPDHSLLDVLKQNHNLEMEIILSKPGCQANLDACNYQINIEHLKRPKVELSAESIRTLTEMGRTFPMNKISLKVTEKNIPYALFILKFEDNNMDYIKLDMYSPFVDNNVERPSMYIFRKMTPELFEHFEGVFVAMWKNDVYSSFVELKCRQVCGYEKAEKHSGVISEAGRDSCLHRN